MKTGELVVGGPRLALFQPSKERLDQLGAWFHAEYPSLLRFAYFVSGSSHAAEDLVHEARGPMVEVRIAHTIGEQAADSNVVAESIDCG